MASTVLQSWPRRPSRPITRPSPPQAAIGQYEALVQTGGEDLKGARDRLSVGQATRAEGLKDLARVVSTPASPPLAQ